MSLERATVDSPIGPTTGRLGMWTFLASDVMSFGGLLAAYAYLRTRAQTWPEAGTRLDVRLAAVMTFVLLASSLTMAFAVDAARAGRARGTAGWLAATLALGAAFLGGQAWEWTALARHGYDFAADHASSTFYVVTGWHGAHVAAGVIYLTVVVARRRLDAVPSAALFWQFLDAVWILIFTALYLV
ncbi:MAG: bb3-type cytochrome oxidase subunit [Myxococcales bacterium]|nr:bb3-type cytochrome oxidase subunit [Myxococcales bacterium]